MLLNPGALDWLYDLHASAESAVLAGGGDEAKRGRRRVEDERAVHAQWVRISSSGTDDALRVGHFAMRASHSQVSLPASTSSSRARGSRRRSDRWLPIHVGVSDRACCERFCKCIIRPELNNRSVDLLGELTLEALNQDALSVTARSCVTIV